jgi:hypothetical protein
MQAKFYYVTLNGEELNDFLNGDYGRVRRELKPKEGFKELYFFRDEVDAADNTLNYDEYWAVGVMLPDEAVETAGYIKFNGNHNTFIAKEDYDKIFEAIGKVADAGIAIEEGSELDVDEDDFMEVYKVKSDIPFDNTFDYTEPIKIIPVEVLL